MKLPSLIIVFIFTIQSIFSQNIVPIDGIKFSDFYYNKNYNLFYDSSRVNQFDQLNKINDNLYAKEKWMLYFDIPTELIIPDIHFLCSHIDQKITLDSFSDTLLLIKNGFRKLKEKFGDFTLNVAHPKNIKDKYISFYLSFSNIVNVNVVVNEINKLPYTNCYFLNSLTKYLYLSNDRSLWLGNSCNDIYTSNPDPNQFWPINYHSRGFAWNIYSVKAPIAWDITKGRKEIVISVEDEFRDDIIEYHDDIKIKTTSNQNDNNWIVLNSSNLGNGELADLCTYSPSPGHGITVLSMAIAKGNNDNMVNPPSNPMGGMVGTCPDCNGIGFLVMSYDPESNMNCDGTDYHQECHQYYKVDTDLIDDPSGNIQRISTFNVSFGDYRENGMKTLISKGIVGLGPAGNSIIPACSLINNPQILNEYYSSGRFDYDQENNLRLWKPYRLGDAQLVYTPDINDPEKDYKVIGVSGLMDGPMLDSYDCTFWDDGSIAGHPVHLGNECFTPDFNYSVGVDKFNTSSGTFLDIDQVTVKSVRNEAKRDAFVDVVAPAVQILVPTPNHNSQMYAFGISGTSLAAPLVEGIVGLMLSINKYLKCDIGINGMPSYGPDVQKKAYNIITFSADKLKDGERQPMYNICSDGVKNVTKIIQTNYLTQSNDLLKRSWAQRMGFGRVNAYRAVAHAIENKGDIIYYESEDLLFTIDDGNGDNRGYVNEDGKKLMHFGSQAVEGLFGVEDDRNGNQVTGEAINVLDFGGANKPSNAFFEWEQYDVNNPHNNQGTTFLHSVETAGNPPLPTPVSLEVGTNCILAIDGIVTSFSEQSSLGNTIKSKVNTNGKILTSGYMKDVNLQGLIKVSDLFIEGTNANAESGGLHFLNTTTEENSEVYGHVVLLDNAFLTVDACTTEVQPGGIIEMKGSKDIIVENGGELWLNGASTIKNADGISYQDRKIIVKTGSKLIVSADAKVEILTKVEVEDGGEFKIKEGAIVKLNTFEIKKGGKMLVNKSTHLNLMGTVSNNYGHLEFDGYPNERIRVTGKIADCCKYICDDADNVIGIAKINSLDIPQDMYSPYFKSYNTDFHNVRTYIKEHGCNIYGCTYNGRDYSNYQIHINNPWLWIDISWTYSGPGIAYLISNCSFSSLDDETLSGFPKYNNTGIKLNNINNIKIDSCKFENLFMGISTSSCTFVEVTSNTFSNGFVGLWDEGSSSLICSNTFSEIDNGIIHFLSLGGKTYNNDFYDNNVAVNSCYGINQKLRGNLFDEYVTAIYSYEGEIMAGDQYTSYECLEGLGRNEFKVQQDKYKNRFSPPYRVDIEAYPADRVYIAEGGNLFSDSAEYHLKGEGSIRVRTNNFRPSSEVRYKDLSIWDNVDLNTSATVNRVCDEYCATPLPWLVYLPHIPCVHDTLYGQFLLEQDEIEPESPEMEFLFEHLRAIMSDTLLPCWCRLAMGYRALHSAMLNDSLHWRLSQLIVAWFQDYNCDPLVTEAQLRKSKIYRKLGYLDSAKMILDDISFDDPDSYIDEIASILSKKYESEIYSNSSISFSLIDSTYIINDSLVAISDSLYSVSMNLLYEFLKKIPDFPKDSVNVAKGTLDFPNQRKLVAYPIYNEAGVRNEDSLYYHLVYTKVEDGVSNVYYSRSQPVHYDGITPVPENDIEWGDYEIKLSDVINCGPYSGTFNCAYPSIVVREDSLGQEPVVKAYVVFSVENNEPLCKDLINFGTKQHAIAEAVFEANLSEESMTFTTPIIIARGNGSDITKWGTPSINASHEGNYYAWSDSLLGIGVKYKEPDKLYFEPNMQTNYVNWSSTYTQQYPSLNSYSRLDQGENEAALVWQEGYDEINTHIYYTRLKVNGNGTLVNFDLPDSIAIKSPPVPIVNADTTILNISEDEMSNKYPVIYRSIQDGSFGNPTAERSFDRIAWQTDSSNILPETYNCSGTISYNPKVINNRLITLHTVSGQLADVFPISTIWHEGGKNLRYPTVAQGNYFQAGALNNIVTEFNALNGCDENDATEFVMWHYPHNAITMSTGTFTDIDDFFYARELSYKGLYPHLTARPFLRDTGSYWQNRRVFLTPDSIISEITVSNEYFSKIGERVSYKPVPFYGYDNKQKRMLISNVKVDSRNVPFDLAEFYSDKNWYLKDTIKTQWFRVGDVSDLDFLQFGDDNINVKMLIEKKINKEKTRMDIIPLRPGKVDKSKCKLINGQGHDYRILLVNDGTLSQFRENVAIMQWPYQEKDDGLQKQNERNLQIIDLGHETIDSDGNSIILNVFPNPADKVLYITAYYPTGYVMEKGSTNKVKLQFFTSIGKNVFEIETKAGETIQIPIDQYGQGAYFVRAEEKASNDFNTKLLPVVKSVIIER